MRLASVIVYIFVFSAAQDGARGLRCHCDVCGKTDNECETDGFCFTSTTLEKGVVTHSYRCLDRRMMFPADNPILCHSSAARNDTVVIECCKENMCNKGIELPLHVRAPGREESRTRRDVALMAGGLAFVLVVCIALLVVQRLQRRARARAHSEGIEAARAAPPCAPSLRAMLEATTSGSGSAGLPLLVQRSIARQIQPLNIIGKGRFGEVWRGRWRGECVAVKIFSSREENSWFREAEIYQTALLRHENILGFIAADNKDNGTWTQLWLITDYHANGSLFDFLNAQTVDPWTLVRMAQSIATGLAHLHMDILGAEGLSRPSGKPAIAHRDLKSKNVLVKADLSCVIGDLGLAVRHDVSLDTVDVPSLARAGTRRYMAPEILDESIDSRQFEPFKRSDVYALGLVFWELARRCSAGPAEEYRPPYFDCVGPDPSLEDMRRAVCLERRRPELPNRWQLHEVLQPVAKVMRECWYQNPAARLTALRIKKTLAVIGVNELIKI